MLVGGGWDLQHLLAESEGMHVTQGNYEVRRTGAVAVS